MNFRRAWLRLWTVISLGTSAFTAVMLANHFIPKGSYLRQVEMDVGSPILLLCIVAGLVWTVAGLRRRRG
jgi:hypothetical protein